MNTSNQEGVYVIGAVGVLICIAVVCWLAWYIWYNIRRKKNFSQTYRFENENRMKMRDNERKIQELRKLLDDANRRIEDGAHDKEVLAAKIREFEEQNAQIKISEQETQAFMSDMAGGSLCNELHALARGGQIAADDMLLQLLNTVDERNPKFTSYIRTNIPEISIQDIYICTLIRLGFGPSEISVLIGRSPTAVTKVRKKLLQKLTGNKGKADEFDKIIREL